MAYRVVTTYFNLVASLLIKALDKKLLVLAF
jgi:hypothetical protein